MLSRSLAGTGFCLAFALVACGGASHPAPAPKAASITRPDRCPGRGENGLAFTADARRATRAVAKRRVGRSPKIDIAVHPVDHAISGCGSKIADRTLEVFTYDHRFDHGPNKSASLAQHRFYVSRFADGYHVWYWEH